MTKNSILCLLIILVTFLTGCNSFAEQDQPEIAGPTPTSLSQSQNDQTPPTVIRSPQTLKIWLPQRFDPALDNPASQLLQTKISDFIEHHPGVRVEVRSKSAVGVGGLINSLSSAAVAAPLALPDLVLLSRPDLEDAATSGILHPLDDLLNNPDDTDWYDFARSLSQIGSQTFGIPFAGDALVMVYRHEDVSQPPSTWTETIQVNTALAFPSADPQALFTIALYQSLGGAVQDADGLPWLSAQPLSSLFTYYTEAHDNGVFPVWLTQHDTDESIWQAFRAGQTAMAVTWSNRFLASPLENISAAPLPSQSGQPYSIATGWAWALTSPQESRHSLSIELAEFLSESDFLSEWTAAAGFLPPRPSALAQWESGPKQALASQIIPSAELIPDKDTIDILGAILSDHVIRLLKGEIGADSAADSAVATALEGSG